MIKEVFGFVIFDIVVYILDSGCIYIWGNFIDFIVYNND